MSAPRGAERSIPASEQYPGLFAIALGDGREIVAVGEGAAEAIRAEFEQREQRRDQPS